MRNVLFRGRAGRRLFARFEKLQKLSARTSSDANARMVKIAGIWLAGLYITCLLFSAYAIAG